MPLTSSETKLMSLDSRRIACPLGGLRQLLDAGLRVVERDHRLRRLEGCLHLLHARNLLKSLSYGDRARRAIHARHRQRYRLLRGKRSLRGSSDAGQREGYKQRTSVHRLPPSKRAGRNKGTRAKTAPAPTVPRTSPCRRGWSAAAHTQLQACTQWPRVLGKYGATPAP